MKTIAKLKVRELKSELTKRNVEFEANFSKAVLVQVCKIFLFSATFAVSESERG